jgi:hypothetical protein
MALAQRVMRLEQLRQIGRLNERCPECGRLPNGRLPDDGSVRFKCCLGGYDPEPTGPEFCLTCRSQLIFRLYFDDRD